MCKELRGALRAPDRPMFDGLACGGFTFAVAAAVVTLMATFVLALLAPMSPAFAAAGSVDVGARVQKVTHAPETGDAGSVDVGVRVGADKVLPENAGGDAGKLDIGVAVACPGYHKVSFVGVYLDDYGNVDTGMGDGGRETLGSATVAHGGHAGAAPAGIERTEYWTDGWYAEDPTSTAGIAPADVDEIAITGDTVLYCLWKRGYVVQLDPNNGDFADALKGDVAAPGYILARPDEAYDAGESGEQPAGVAYADFPEATRPGYVFKGWYWGKTKVENRKRVLARDERGRVVLDEGAGLVAPGTDAAGELDYVTIRDRSLGEFGTLYAKWEVAPCVRVGLTGARDANMDEGVGMWFWPGRGYTLDEPTPDMELVDGAVLAAPGEVALGERVAHNPVPGYSTQYFSGWGYVGAHRDGDAFEDDCLVSCRKIEDADGLGGRYVYELTERAFADAYVDANMNWVDSTFTEADDERPGGRATGLDALFTAAHIRVSAPFEVTFEKAGAGYDPDTNAGAVEPYSPDELEWDGTDGGAWIQSLGQRFTNRSERSVYVSGVECRNTGASAILPGGAGGARLFSLHEGDGEPAGGTAVSFGWSTAGNANVASVDPYREDSWIVLPVAEGDGFSKELYYGLNLKEAAFDRTAVAVGGPGGETYVAKLANVKYTYSIVP